MTADTPRQAMVLAAGRGLRMRPLTDHKPKPMIEVAGRTLIDRTLDQLEAAGIERVVVNTSYKAEILESHLATRRTPDIILSREAEPLETGGGIFKALSHFKGQPFFCVNGDVIWTDGAVPALRRLADHWSGDLDALLLMQPLTGARGYDGKGDFFMDVEGRLVRRGSRETAPYVYAALQILHPRLFKDCPPGAFSLNVLYDRAINADPPRIRGVLHDGDWLHVGDARGRDEAERHLLAHTVATALSAPPVK